MTELEPTSKVLKKFYKQKEERGSEEEKEEVA